MNNNTAKHADRSTRTVTGPAGATMVLAPWDIMDRPPRPAPDPRFGRSILWPKDATDR